MFARGGVAMSFENSLQPHLAEVLKNAIQRNRLAHAYIFYGPKNTGKREMALELAKAANCERNEADACDRCPSCIQIAQGNHPEVLKILPEGNVIKIAQLRQLQSRFRYSAPEGVTRFAIIEEAEKMRDEAANSLLKFLEEPQSAMVVILITRHLSDVIPTIKSRCQLVRFSEIPPSVKKEQLLKKGIPEELAGVFARLSGSLETDGEAYDDGKIKHYASVVHHVKEWGGRILSGSPDALLTLSESWLLDEVKEERAWFLLDVLLLYYRDILMNSLKGETEIFRDSGIERLSMRHSPGKIMLAMDNVLIARRLLVRPQLNWQGIFEQMIVAVSEERLSMKNGWELIPLSKV